MKGLSRVERQVQKTRQKRYKGTTTFNHKNLGMIWTALLRSYYGHEDMPILSPQMVLLMMAASKLNRAAREDEKKPLVDQDNFIDAKIYIELARQARLGENDESPKS